MIKTYHDYESLGTIQSLDESEVPVLETLSGSAVVSWYSQIEDWLQKQLDNQEAARNHENADRLRAFLNTWRENELDGSKSIDNLKPLKAAAQQGAAVKSPLRGIFSAILRNLRKLIADEEQLPPGVDTNAIDPMSAGLGRGAPPMSPDFGPEEQPPEGMEPGAPGGPEGAPGGAEGEPGAQAGLEPGPGEEKVMAAAGQAPLLKRPRK